jgi:hypothetical membrane protein
MRSGRVEPAVSSAAALVTWGPRAGLIGGLVFGGATVVAALAFGGAGGSIYSPLIQFVSELGEVGRSALGVVFNAGLIVGGAGFAIFMAAFGALRGGRLALVTGAVGVAAGLFGALVGVFPLGGSDLHRPVSIGFFLLGALTLALATVDVARQPSAAFPRWLAVVGAVVVAAFVGFIVLTLQRGSGDLPDPLPAFLLETAIEWVAVGGILAWTALASITWLRAGAGAGAPGRA